MTFLSKVLRFSVTGASVPLLSAFALGSSSGCYGDQCEQSEANVDAPGRLIDADTWESTPVDSNWLLYSGQHTWVFHPHVLDGRDIRQVNVFISPDEFPNKDKTDTEGRHQWTQAGGNLAQITVLKKDGGNAIYVWNNTCASYFVRIEVTAYPAS
ncbi:hypothetical protein LZC95_22290 [Pendulispora brunnea]|uniref:Secreted protein n=1 Tax=Pendulispora brunnea TaxID=2905690 RepID=A0ABZ2KPN6_9BACT